MLYKTNVVGLVGGGPRPRFPENKVALWDDHQLRSASELTYKSEVRGVQLSRTRLAVVLELKVLYYNFDDLHLIDTIETCRNPLGVCCLSQDPQMELLACLFLAKGNIRLQLYYQKRTVVTSAHDSSITCMCLSHDARLLAVACDKGTLVRIFNTSDGIMQQELRRGIDKAVINYMTFDVEAMWLACCSDKDSVHIFVVLKGGFEDAGARNTTSSLGFFRKLLPKYFDSEWSFAKLRVSGRQKVCTFGPEPGSLIGTFHSVVSYEGVYFLASFDTEKGGDGVVQVIKRLPITKSQ